MMKAEFQKDEFDKAELEAGGNKTSCKAIIVVQIGDVQIKINMTQF